MSHSNNIQLFRKKLGISAEGLAKMVGCSVPQIYQLEKGSRGLDQDWMIKISKALDCKPEDLIKLDISFEVTADNKIKIVGERSYAPVYRVSDSGKISDEDGNQLVTIPLYDSKASAGHGQWVVSTDVEMQVILTIFNQMTGMNLKDKDVKEGRFSFIQVDGDSMEPYIESGNLLLVDHNKLTIEQYRQILVFRDAENELYVKEVHKPYGNKLSIISYNPTYKSWIEEPRDKIFADFCGEINIVGKVIWHGNKTTYFKTGSTFKP